MGGEGRRGGGGGGGGGDGVVLILGEKGINELVTNSLSSPRFQDNLCQKTFCVWGKT